MNHIKILILISLLTGCSNVQIPHDQQNKRVFVQNSTLPYKDAYRIIAKQMKACYRVLGVFGNGYDTEAELDSQNNQGRVELYTVGLTGAGKPEDSIFSRTVVIKKSKNGSIITTSGTTPKHVFRTHKTIPKWLKGKRTCSP